MKVIVYGTLLILIMVSPKMFLSHYTFVFKNSDENIITYK